MQPNAIKGNGISPAGRVPFVGLDKRHEGRGGEAEEPPQVEEAAPPQVSPERGAPRISLNLSIRGPKLGHHPNIGHAQNGAIYRNQRSRDEMGLRPSELLPRFRSVEQAAEKQGV